MAGCKRRSWDPSGIQNVFHPHLFSSWFQHQWITHCAPACDVWGSCWPTLIMQHISAKRKSKVCVPRAEKSNDAVLGEYTKHDQICFQQADNADSAPIWCSSAELQCLQRLQMTLLQGRSDTAVSFSSHARTTKILSKPRALCTHYSIKTHTCCCPALFWWINFKCGLLNRLG